MEKRRLAGAVAVGLLFSFYACVDATSPRKGILLPPINVSALEQVPPDVSLQIGPYYGNTITLHNFPYETWASLEVSGYVEFTSRPPAPGASPYYQTPGRNDVTATGVYDGRNDSRCAMNLSVNGALVNGGNFGVCGGAYHDDTVKIVGGSTTVRRGQIPYNTNPYDCDPWGNLTCHAVYGVQTVRLRPIPIALKKPTASPRTVNFEAGSTQITFTAAPSPGTLLLGGNPQNVTLAVTLWQWVGADSTRSQVPSGPPCAVPSAVAANRTCLFTPQESGRMTVKAFVGGYEQTNSVTVQCLVNPADSILNDTTNDFQVRSAIIELNDSSYGDVPPGYGYDPAKGRGLKHEIEAFVWQLPNGGGFMLTAHEDLEATECEVHPSIMQFIPPPVPGAIPIGRAHSHPTKWGDPVYGCPPLLAPNGDSIRYSKFPGDTANGKRPQIQIRLGEDSTGMGLIKGGSVPDWQSALAEGKPWYTVHAEGEVSLLNFQNLVGPHTPWFWNKKAKKCTWVR